MSHTLTDQAIAAAGPYFGLRNRQSENYLSAFQSTPVLGTMPHLAGWEQWEKVDRGGGTVWIQSFHGSVLSAHLDAGRGMHVPFFESIVCEPPICRVSVVPVPDSPSGDVALVFQDKVLVEWTNEVISGQTITTISTETIPLNGLWSIVTVPIPSPGRTPLASGFVDNQVITLQSTHGTRLTLGAATRHGYVAIHVTSPGSADRVKLACVRKGPYNAVPIYFEGTELLLELSGPGNETLYLTSTDDLSRSGLKMLEWMSFPTSTSHWRIHDPTGRFKVGTFVQTGVPVVLRNETGLYLSADPGLPRVQMSPNTAAWEQWFLLPH